MGRPWGEMTGGNRKESTYPDATGRTGNSIKWGRIDQILCDMEIGTDLAPMFQKVSTGKRLRAVRKMSRVLFPISREWNSQKLIPVFFAIVIADMALCASGRRTLKMKNASSRTKKPAWKIKLNELPNERIGGNCYMAQKEA